MTAMLEYVADISDPGAAAAELGSLNHRLAAERTIPPAVSAAVHDVAAGVTETARAHWERIDPRHAVLLLQSVVAAQEAIEDRRPSRGRDRLRIALESMRQAFAAIAEGEELSDERSPKQIVRWLVETTEVPQARLAALVGVSPRQFQRWASPNEAAQPEGDDARRVRAIARIVNQLRFALTPGGTIDWFDWPRRDLRGRSPRELLADPKRLPQLTAAAAAMRSTSGA
jgi:hypothetical protein